MELGRRDSGGAWRARRHEGEEGARAAQGRSTSLRARCSSVSVMARPARSKESDARRASEEALRDRRRKRSAAHIRNMRVWLSRWSGRTPYHYRFYFSPVSALHLELMGF